MQRPAVRASAGRGAASAILHLQRSAGNKAVATLLADDAQRAPVTALIAEFDGVGQDVAASGARYIAEVQASRKSAKALLGELSTEAKSAVDASTSSARAQVGTDVGNETGGVQARGNAVRAASLGHSERAVAAASDNSKRARSTVSSTSSKGLAQLSTGQQTSQSLLGRLGGFVTAVLKSWVSKTVANAAPTLRQYAGALSARVAVFTRRAFDAIHGITNTLRSRVSSLVDSAVSKLKATGAAILQVIGSIAAKARKTITAIVGRLQALVDKVIDRIIAQIRQLVARATAEAGEYGRRLAAAAMFSADTPAVDKQ